LLILVGNDNNSGELWHSELILLPLGSLSWYVPELSIDVNIQPVVLIFTVKATLIIQFKKGGCVVFIIDVYVLLAYVNPIIGCPWNVIV